jgi:hypothetical protein
VDQLAGRRVLLAHGSADTVTRPGDTWTYADRARAVCHPTVIEVRGGDHPMLRRARLWHAIAAEFSRVSFGLSPDMAKAAAAAAAVAAPSGEPGVITVV